MRTELPEKWTLKAEKDNQIQATAIAEYMSPLSIKQGSSNWTIEDAFEYYGTILNGKYDGGTRSLPYGVELITFEEFEHLVLNKQIQSYEIF